MQQRRIFQFPLRAVVAGLLASLVVSSCSALAAHPEPLLSATIAPLPHTPAPTPTPTLTPTLSPTLAPTPIPNNLWIDLSGVSAHPDGALYSGDVLSFRIEAHNGGDTDLSRVPLIVDWGSGHATGEIPYLPRGGSGATDLTWVWDTGSLVGTQTITVTLDPDNTTGDPDPGNNVAVASVDLRAGRPAGEIDAQWQTITSACCEYHFITHTAAARDIARITRTADDAIALVERRLGIEQKNRLTIYLIDRVLGHGGFASGQIVISYLDRNYAGGELEAVFRHEGTHILDQQVAKGERPSLLVEGFAVYVAGGHFKIEPLPERAASLLSMGAYIPLRDLANNFYPSQHETGYLEAGAFVDYLIERDGYDRFIELYGGMQREPGERDAALIDREMQAVYGIGLDAMQAEWRAHLRTLDAGDQRRDVAETIAFYDTLRRYQRALDPFAHFQNAWMPDIREAEERGRVADYVRHPRAPENVALETMLVAADEALLARDYDRVETLLQSVNAVLDANGVFADPIAAQYLGVVRAALAAGYEPQRITVEGARAEVWATQSGGAALVRLDGSLQDGAWSVQ